MQRIIQGEKLSNTDSESVSLWPQAQIWLILALGSLGQHADQRVLVLSFIVSRGGVWDKRNASLLVSCCH